MAYIKVLGWETGLEVAKKKLLKLWESSFHTHLWGFPKVWATFFSLLPTRFLIPGPWFQVVDCNEGRDTKRACSGLVFGFLVLTAILTTVLTSAGYNHKNNRLVITNHGHNRGFYIGCAASGYNRNFNLGWSLGVVAGWLHNLSGTQAAPMHRMLHTGTYRKFMPSLQLITKILKNNSLSKR